MIFANGFYKVVENLPNLEISNCLLKLPAIIAVHKKRSQIMKTNTYKYLIALFLLSYRDGEEKKTIETQKGKGTKRRRIIFCSKTSGPGKKLTSEDHIYQTMLADYWKMLPKSRSPSSSLSVSSQEKRQQSPGYDHDLSV